MYDSLTLKSKILGIDRSYAIYLPPGYNENAQQYPVLYLLHGSGDNQTAWLQFGNLQNILEKLISSGDAFPMVVVMPDAGSVRQGYMNDRQGKWRYEDFFFEEFMPYIEKTYHIKKDRRYRAIAG